MISQVRMALLWTTLMFWGCKPVDKTDQPNLPIEDSNSTVLRVGPETNVAIASNAADRSKASLKTASIRSDLLSM